MAGCPGRCGSLAIKHSGVRHFEVELQGTSEAILLSVRDQGVGFDDEKMMTSRGLGITSMQERLKAVHGELSIVSHLSQGTTVCARVPIDTIGVYTTRSGLRSLRGYVLRVLCKDGGFRACLVC